MAVDILMMIKGSKGALAGEGQSSIDPKDPLTTDFKAGQFFELDDFDFGIDVIDKDDNEPTGAAPLRGTSSRDSRDSRDGRDSKKEKGGGKFAKWVQGVTPKSPQGANGSMYPIEMEPFSFSKQLDRSSVFLFLNCFKVNQLASAAVVMRKSAGTNSNIGNIAFLRIDFTDVLIISVDWDGSENVKEKCKFVCRSVKVRYYPQNMDGSQGNIAQTEDLSLKDVTQSSTG